jgi:hypothetical protein
MTKAKTKSVLKYSEPELCPDWDKHTAAPRSYLEWHEWAEDMAKTHKQERCPTCGYWAMWTPKTP